MISKEQLAKRIHLDTLEDYKIFPKYFQIEPTDLCNAKCIMCSKSVTQNSHHSIMKEELFGKILAELQSYTNWIEMITIQWMGEPLMDLGLESKIKKLKDIGIKTVSLSTNASLLDKNRSISLFQSGLDDLRISIDSIDKETFEKVRVGLNFDEVIKNACQAIKVRNEMKPDTTIRIRMVEMDETKEQVSKWKKFWEIHLGKNDVAQVMPGITSKNWSTNIKKSIGTMYELMDPCISVFSTMIINADGKVALCCVDSEIDESLGDIRNNTIKEIWQSFRFENIRNMHLNGCRNEIEICKTCKCWDREFY